MSGNGAIIERCEIEVNARCGESARNAVGPRLARTLIAALAAAAVLLAVGCGGRERRAERLHRRATQAAQEGKLDEAAEMFGRILREYPETRVADRAEGDLRLYGGLAGAVKNFPVRQATDRMILTARALDRYRSRKRTYPEDLASLVPDHLEAFPTDAWGQPFSYHVKGGGRGYVLSCLGADGAPGGSGDSGDIVVEDGRFVRGGSPP
jgi:hypothetical protein